MPSASATSTGSGNATPPALTTSRRAPSSPARPRASSATRAPRRANAIAVARPTPADAPVTTTTRSVMETAGATRRPRRFASAVAGERSRLPILHGNAESRTHIPEQVEDSYMASNARQLAVVTGASSGIGYELAKLCAQNGYDLVIAADDPSINQAASAFQALGASVHAVLADLATTAGVDQLVAAVKGRPVDALLANAGHGLGQGFLDQDFDEIQHVIDTNITGTVYLIHQVGRQMRSRGQGRILITGSIAGFMPGTYQAVYNGTKAYLDSLSFAVRAEVADRGVTVTCLMPGATETEFFERADMMDTKVGTAKKDDPAMVAETGFKAMMRGDGDVVSGWHNKLQTAIASVTPAGL